MSCAGLFLQWGRETRCPVSKRTSFDSCCWLMLKYMEGPVSILPTRVCVFAPRLILLSLWPLLFLSMSVDVRFSMILFDIRIIYLNLESFSLGRYNVATVECKVGLLPKAILRHFMTFRPLQLLKLDKRAER